MPVGTSGNHFLLYRGGREVAAARALEPALVSGSCSDSGDRGVGLRGREGGWVGLRVPSNVFVTRLYRTSYTAEVTVIRGDVFQGGVEVRLPTSVHNF